MYGEKTSDFQIIIYHNLYISASVLVRDRTDDEWVQPRFRNPTESGVRGDREAYERRTIFIYFLNLFAVTIKFSPLFSNFSPFSFDSYIKKVGKKRIHAVHKKEL